MRPYTKRFGGFAPIAAYVAGTALATIVVKPLVETFPLWLQVIAYLLLLFVVFFLFYSANIISILIWGREDLAPRVAAAWHARIRSTLSGLPAPNLAIDDYVDRAAQLCISLSVPLAIQDVTVSLLKDQHTTCHNLTADIERLRSDDRFSAIVSALANEWRSNATVQPRSARLIDDPVYGCVVLDEKLATLAAHPMVQRLNRVRQLSFSYSQYPSASHSRFSHSLGVAKNAELALSGVFDRGVYYELGTTTPKRFPANIMEARDEIVQKAKLIALLHDLGHGPFGHALDTFIGFEDPSDPNPKPDQKYTALYILNQLAPALRDLGFAPDNIVQILDQRRRNELVGLDAFIADVVDSSLDTDRMDYLIRDSHMTGLQMGFTNTASMLAFIRPVSEGDSYLISFDEAALGYMEHFLYARDAMYHNCYEHPKKKAAERIFQKLVIELVRLGVPVADLFALTDEELLSLVRAIGPSAGAVQALARELMTDLDYTIAHQVHVSSSRASAAVKSWYEMAVKNEEGEPKQCYITQPATWEEAIAGGSIGRDRSREIQVVVPTLFKSYLQYHSSMRVLCVSNGRYDAKEFFDQSAGLKEVLKHLNEQRNKIVVMCPSTYDSQTRAKVRDIAIQRLGE